jgi:hypothetical protein
MALIMKSTHHHSHHHHRRALLIFVVFMLGVSLHCASSFVLAPVVPFAVVVGTGSQRGSSRGDLSPTTITSSFTTTRTSTTCILCRTSRPWTTGAAIQPTRRDVFNLYSSTRPNTETENNANDELPANLKRKVDAKRPPLGHVIPKATKSKKKGGEGSFKINKKWNESSVHYVFGHWCYTVPPIHKLMYFCVSFF